jgi:hypothetical protein
LRRNRLAAALLAAALAAPAAADDWISIFPKGGEVFTPLLADPREIQLSTSYDRRNGENDADAALGHSWGLVRWRSGILSDWLWQVDVEGMAYSRFKLGGGGGLEAVDFFANLPLEVRKGGVSFKAELFHRESHLGDDSIRDTGNLGFRSSAEGVRGLAALDPCRFLRVYAGPSWLIDSVPAPQRWTLQSGLELTSDDLHWSSRAPMRLFLAEDVQSRENVQWNTDSNTVAGLKIGSRDATRAMRVQVGYFTGHSPFGQFYAQREHYADVGLSFDL